MLRLKPIRYRRINQFNLRHVISIFKTFADKHPPVKPDSLAQQVAPSTVASAAPIASTPAKPILSQKFIEKFFNDVARGKYKANPAEEQRLRNEIDMAAAEGRVR